MRSYLSVILTMKRIQTQVKLMKITTVYTQLHRELEWETLVKKLEFTPARLSGTKLVC